MTRPLSRGCESRWPERRHRSVADRRAIPGKAQSPRNVGLESPGLVASWTRGAPTSERVELGVRLGEVAHFANHGLGLLRHHREARWLGVQAAGAETNQLEAHRSQYLTAMIELLLRLLLLATYVGERAALPAQHCQSTDSLFAGAIVERIGLGLQRIDLSLDAFAGLATRAAIEIGERQRELLNFAKDLVGGGPDLRNLLAVVGRHVEQLAMYLAVVALGVADRSAIARVSKRSGSAGRNWAETRRRTTDSRVGLEGLHRRHRGHR